MNAKPSQDAEGNARLAAPRRSDEEARVASSPTPSIPLLWGIEYLAPG
jgi:hypothetical protein